jgi:hypothetical protein
MAGRVIAVTGLPTSNYGKVSKFLESQGWAILWDGQDIGIDECQALYDKGENIELLRMHELILSQTGQSWFTERAPRYYDVPYPGPEEFLAQFKGRNVVLADPRLVFFFPMWNHLVDHLFICGIDPEESAKAMYRHHQKRAALDLCRGVAQHYRMRMHETVTAAMWRHTRLPVNVLETNEFQDKVDRVQKALLKS